VVFSITFLLPFLLIWVSVKLGLVRSVELDTQEERVYGLFFALISYAVLYYFLEIRLNMFDSLVLVVLTAMIALVVSFAVNFFIQTSLHLAGMMSGVVVLILQYSIYPSNKLFYVNMGAILLSGLVASARLYLGKHNIYEIMSGSIIGICAALGANFILNYL
jgi:membrane-associated phospholipid phosphatase